MRSVDTCRPPDSGHLGRRPCSASPHPPGNVTLTVSDQRTPPGAMTAPAMYVMSRALRLSSRAHASASVVRCAPGSDSCCLRATASQNGEHRATLQRRLALDRGDVGNAGSDGCNLRPGDVGMRCFTPAESDLDFDFVTFFQEPSRRAHADLQVVLVSARSQADLFHLRHVLVLFRVARALALLEPEASQVGNATHGWIGCCGDFDQVEPRFFCAAQGGVDVDDANLFAVFVDNTDLRHADLAIGTRAGWDWWARVKWSTGNGQLPPYFFLGPLLTIGGLGAALVRLPPRFDIVVSFRM